MKIKKLAVGFIAALMLMMLSGCSMSGSTSVMSTSTYTPNGWQTTYQLLDGTKDVHFTVPDGKNCLVSAVVTTESGTLYLEVKDSKDNVLYTSETFSANGSFETMVEGGGTYYVYLNAAEHRGSVELEWNVIGGEEG